MITSTHIIQLSHLLSEDEVIRVVFTGENEVEIGAKDELDESSDNTAVFIKRVNGRCVIINLDKVDFVCISKRFL